MPVFPVYSLRELGEEELRRILSRSRIAIEKVEGDVKRILEDVRERGDEAIAEFLSTQVGRAVKPEEIVVKQEDIGRAYKELDSRVLKAIRHMIRNVRRFHRRQLPRSWFIKIEDGVYAGQLVIPLASAGLYVPSGKATYPSVAVMVTVPASVAGVPRIAVASPPYQNELKMDPATLVAAHMAGAHEFYIMGGAHAIAAFAYGTRLVKPVEVIAGPGGPYTYAAKLMVRDLVRIDIPAGPSEALIYADGTLPPSWVAWDFLNEAEHGPDSAAVLLTTSIDYARKVSEELDRAVEMLPEPRRSYVLKNAGKFSAIIVVESLDEAIEFMNRYAPEHLLIDSRNARRIFQRIRDKLRNFGTLCLNTPISAGNYGVGPNATLPTGGYARLYSGLSVDCFLKKPTIEEVRGRNGLRKMLETVLALAEYEGFPAHAEAMRSRASRRRG
ncbi:MAG: histidinol dehydrogenase [Thaumarchaeota archaeon]|nr:MAG: histidinol dehydrogenase [Nitrososphaerota archaeon]